VHRALILLLFGLVLAGGAAVTWQAMGRAKLVEEDLTTARALLARAGVTLFKQQQVSTPEVTVEAPGGEMARLRLR
jgi:hypothetical protein